MMVKEELFTLEDVLEALRNCNFNKGIGPDWFNGSVLKGDPRLRDEVAKEIQCWLNQG